jgi:penicillin-binding protein-related factor A (putative recombinase)
MRENKFQTIFNKWLIDTQFEHSFAAELKVTKKHYIAFSNIKPHQLNALWQVKHRRFAYKISDISLGQKPFDSFFLYRIPAYVVILYYKGAKRINTAYMIDIDDFISEMKSSKRKSLLEHRALAIAYKMFNI